MAGPKFYAVRVGVTPGIYKTWAECEPMIHGIKGAKYKSFPTLEQAQAYLNGEEGPLSEDPAEETAPAPKRRKKTQEEDVPYVVPHGTLVAFVDGSFDAKTGRYGYGCVLLTDDGREICENGWGDHPEAVSARNVAGELRATMIALRRAEEMGYKTLRICHDYNGISAWFEGRWKANSFVAKEYIAVAESYRNVLSVSFEKIAAHTGVKYNEMADRLAKDALGIE
ncbi:MAG: ribonuclease H family protein [Clostridia bacterium]|nr:ribonuclease H family protein [Clostridia bacterium]